MVAWREMEASRPTGRRDIDGEVCKGEGCCARGKIREHGGRGTIIDIVRKLQPVDVGDATALEVAADQD